MVHHGLTAEEAYERFYVVDAQGLVTSVGTSTHPPHD